MGDVVTYTDTTVTNGFTYYYEVSAVNRFGVGSRSNEVAATPVPLPDSTAPSIRISSPLNNTIVSSTTVVVTGTASDNVAVQTVELSTDGTTWIAASGTTTWSGSVTLHAGTNVIYARATDTSGNRATVHIIVTVENAGPGSSGLDPVILATILVAIGAVGFAAGFVGLEGREPGEHPPGQAPLYPQPAPRPTHIPSANVWGWIHPVDTMPAIRVAMMIARPAIECASTGNSFACCESGFNLRTPRSPWRPSQTMVPEYGS